MTEEFKSNLLNYLTNNIITTNPDSKEIFIENKSISRNDWVKFIPNKWNSFRYEGMISPDESLTGIGVLYGGYLDSNNNSYGIVTLFDNNFIPIKTIYEYSSGTKLRYIQYMKQAEDGTFYFVDDTAFSFAQGQKVITSQKRFVMVGNFTVKNKMTNDYQIDFRKSYVFSGNYVNFYCKNMFKNPNSSHYILFGTGADSTSSNYSFRYLKIFSLKINVGEENEWILYCNEQYRLFGSAYALFDNDDNVYFRCLSTKTNMSNRNVDCVYKNYNDENTTTTTIATFSYPPYIDDDSYKKQSVFLNMDNVYFVTNNQNWGISGTLTEKYIGLHKYNFSTSTLTTIFNKYIGEYDYCDLTAIYIDKGINDIYVQYNENISDENGTADYYFQRLNNNTWNPILIGKNKPFRSYQRSLFIKTNFNLVQIYMYATNPRIPSWFEYLIKEDYNSLNYNGDQYIDYYSMIPSKGQLYSNNSIVFARNLYNKTVNDNVTISTIVIPNSYLNDLIINFESLLSETNLNMVTDNTDITKNMYETGYLNFVNTINAIDDNNNQSLYLQNQSTYINTNINVGTSQNYNNTFIGKAKINYSNDQTFTIPIKWQKLSDCVAKTKFYLQVSDNIESIEFTSDDGLTTYLTVTPNELNIGSSYILTQYLTTDKKLYISNLNYDNKQIKYNGENVVAYSNIKGE